MARREKGMCSSWFKDATHTCLTWKEKFRMQCSVFENSWDVPSWRAEASVAYCKACFHEKMKRQVEVTGTSSEGLLIILRNDENRWTLSVAIDCLRESIESPSKEKKRIIHLLRNASNMRAPSEDILLRWFLWESALMRAILSFKPTN